jgi:hypothetical protein
MKYFFALLKQNVQIGLEHAWEQAARHKQRREEAPEICAQKIIRKISQVVFVKIEDACQPKS